MDCVTPWIPAACLEAKRERASPADRKSQDVLLYRYGRRESGGRRVVQRECRRDAGGCGRVRQRQERDGAFDPETRGRTARKNCRRKDSAERTGSADAVASRYAGGSRQGDLD